MHVPSLPHLPNSLDTHYVLITSVQQHQCHCTCLLVRTNTVPASLSLQKQAGSVPTEN